MSHPAWVRGLKHAGEGGLCHQKNVAPCVGAWIETARVRTAPRYGASHPAWVRGLKQTDLAGAKALWRRTLRGCVD